MFTACRDTVRNVSVAAAMCVVAVAAAAQEGPSPPLPRFDEGHFTAFSFYVENDLLQKGRLDEDRNYTGGFGFQFNGSFIESARLDRPLAAVDRWTRVGRKHESDPANRHFYTLLVFGTAFTPDNLNTSLPIRDDRPYGSLVAVSVRHMSVDNDSLSKAWSSELVIGALGLAVARNLQTSIHRELRAHSGLSTPYDPLGWHNQISDGGEPTALYHVRYERRLFDDSSRSGIRKHIQVSGGLEGSAGYYTNAGALLNSRVGVFNSEFWQFRPDSLGVGQEVLGDRKVPRWELFAFANVRPRFNIYNALLQGQFRDSAVTVPIRRGTLEWDLGAAAYIPALRMQVSWNVLAGRTSEMKVGTPRTHTWGSVVLTYAPRLSQQ